jgi:hypothetical protein
MPLPLRDNQGPVFVLVVAQARWMLGLAEVTGDAAVAEALELMGGRWNDMTAAAEVLAAGGCEVRRYHAPCVDDPDHGPRFTVAAGELDAGEAARLVDAGWLILGAVEMFDGNCWPGLLFGAHRDGAFQSWEPAPEDPDDTAPGIAWYPFVSPFGDAIRNPAQATGGNRP